MTEVQPGETYPEKQVRAAAIDVGDHWELSELQLAAGETAWNPLSTKGPLVGPMGVKYVMHPTGINVGLYQFGQCLGIDEVITNGVTRYVQCGIQVGRKARCEKHLVTPATKPAAKKTAAKR